MTVTYNGRTLEVEATGNAAEPYRLVGPRGGSLTLVATVSNPTGLFWVKCANGKINGGFVGLLDDGSLLWLPSSGKGAYAAKQTWKARRAA